MPEFCSIQIGIGVFIGEVYWAVLQMFMGKKRLDCVVTARALTRISQKRGVLLREKHHMGASLSI